MPNVLNRKAYGTESSTPRAAGPTLARIINNGRAVIGAEGNSDDATLDSPALRVIGIEFPRKVRAYPRLKV